MIEALIAGAAYFVFVFFKAFQQRNIAFNHYAWVIPISYAMSVTEIAVIAVVSLEAVEATHWLDLLPVAVGIGTGGGSGAVASMWLHNRIFRSKT